MLFKNIDILDENFEHKKGYYVGIKNDIITYISKEKPLEDFGEVYNGRNKLLMPGFTNAHSHSAMTLMRGYAENLALSDWLNNRIFPFEAQLDYDAVYNGTMLAIAEMLRFGIVSTTDMYFNASANSCAVIDSGIKMNLGVHATCFDNSSLNELPVYNEWLKAINDYHNLENGRLKIDLALHAEYTSTQKITEQFAAFAKEKGLNTHIHMSETKSEHEECKLRHNGKTPAKYFYDCGLFDSPTTAAHCVWLENEDFDILNEKNVTVAACPVSNLKLASGFVDAPKLLKKGINVALGTDSVASNNNLNILEEIKLFATLFKATSGDPTAITPKEALFAATRAGALSQGRNNCGILKEGYKADLIVIDTENRPYLTPCHNMINNIVFSALGTDVVLTMVDGKVLYCNGEYHTIDLEKIKSNTEDSIKNILNKL